MMTPQFKGTLKSFAVNIFELQDKSAEQNLWELLDVIGAYFGKISGPDVILESIDRLGKMISTFISEEKPKGFALNFLYNIPSSD